MRMDTHEHFIKTGGPSTGSMGNTMVRDRHTSDAEVIGNNLRALMDSMGLMKLEAQRLLGEQGILEAQPGQWYPLQAVTRSLDSVRQQVGPRTVRAIGQRITTYAIVPSHIDSFPRLLPVLDSTYRLNHRGSRGLGGYHYLGGTATSARLRCDNPYPCEFDQGLFEGFHERFTPSGSFRLRIVHEPGGCRTEGAEACQYHLTW
jgi:hypothetical protein